MSIPTRSITGGVDDETRSKVEAYLQQIAERDYPPVYVVEMYSEPCMYIWSLETHGLSDEQRVELAREAGIPVLNGLEVVQNLRSEMAPEDEWVLKEEVMRIFAAKMGMVVVGDTNPDRMALTGVTGEAPLAGKMVPVEGLVQRDLEEWEFFDTLEALTEEQPISFLIPRTPRVKVYLANRNG